MKKRSLFVAGLLVLAMVSGAGCGSGKEKTARGKAAKTPAQIQRKAPIRKRTVLMRKSR